MSYLVGHAMQRCGLCGAEWWDAHVCPRIGIEYKGASAPKSPPLVTDAMVAAAAASLRAAIEPAGWPTDDEVRAAIEAAMAARGNDE